MDDGGLEVGADDGGRLERAIRALGAASKEAPADIKKVIVELAESLAHEASVSVLAEPTHGLKHTGLRAEVAEGVGTMEIDGGVRITTSMPSEDKAMIPRGFDTAASRRGWRHPLFGDKTQWYRNYGGFSWFLGSMQNGDKDGEERLSAIMSQLADKIARDSK